MTRKRKDDNKFDGIQAEAFFVAGSPTAMDYNVTDNRCNCVRCGASIRNVFATSHGFMGGDCLATLTGIDITRISTNKVVKIAKKVGKPRGVIVKKLIKPETRHYQVKQYFYSVRLVHDQHGAQRITEIDWSNSKAKMNMFAAVVAEYFSTEVLAG